MKNSTILKIILLVSGVVAVLIGGLSLFTPVSFHGSAGIILGDNLALLSEIRSAGGLLLLGGFVILSGIFSQKMAFSAILLSVVMYLSYGLSRLYSILVDGNAGEVLLMATGLELVLGLVSLFALLKYQLHA